MKQVTVYINLNYFFYKGVADTKTALKTYENIAEDIITNDKVILNAILIKYFLNN